MKQTIKSPFRVKNGKRFQNTLIKAAEGDSNIGKMFTDNLKYNIRNFIVKGSFKTALVAAFNWASSNEGHDFWEEVYNNMEK